MNKLVLHSEAFQPEGGAAGQGIMRALGMPRLDHISVLVREAVQNSWDARVDNGADTEVTFSASLEKFSDSQLKCLRGLIFSDKPVDHPLKEHLKGRPTRLILQDRGTVGLTGPAFVERPPKPEDRFVNFCRMFGRASEGAIGGGTYGYGKAVYYKASAAASIIVHTRTAEKSGLCERLIAMSLWKTSKNNLDTGRYWWGELDARNRVAPVEGDAANQMALEIGFHKFTGSETGTSIMIVAPSFQIAADTLEAAAKCIGESMVIWFWPRMIGGGDNLGKISFNVSCSGKEVPIPDPKHDAPFNIYSSALDNLEKHVRKKRQVHPPSIIRGVRCEKPAAKLGWLSLALAAKHPREEMAIGQIEGHVFAEQVDQSANQVPASHHVALMRGPGQVIKYCRCRSYPDEGMEYAGVFIVDGSPEVGKAFALSEPPTHDDWTPDDLEDPWHKRYVRAAFREIRDITDSFADAGKPLVEATEQEPLGAISSELGELMSAPGTGPRPPTGKRGGGGGIRNDVRLQITGDGSLEQLDGDVVFILPFRVLAGSNGASIVQAHPKVLLAGGGAESEAPIGDDDPELIGWRKPSGRIIRDQRLKIKSEDHGDWQAIVRMPGDAMIGVTLEVIS